MPILQHSTQITSPRQRYEIVGNDCARRFALNRMLAMKTQRSSDKEVTRRMKRKNMNEGHLPTSISSGQGKRL
jgi:hypothetical protein